MGSFNVAYIPGLHHLCILIHFKVNFCFSRLSRKLAQYLLFKSGIVVFVIVIVYKAMISFAVAHVSFSVCSYACVPCFVVPMYVSCFVFCNIF